MTTYPCGNCDHDPSSHALCDECNHLLSLRIEWERKIMHLSMGMIHGLPEEREKARRHLPYVVDCMADIACQFAKRTDRIAPAGVANAIIAQPEMWWDVVQGYLKSIERPPFPKGEGVPVR